MVEAFGVVVALVLLIGAVLLLVPLRWPAGSWLLAPKLLVAALVPGVGALASALAVVGVVAGMPLLGMLAGVTAVVAGVVWARVAAARSVRPGGAGGETPVGFGRGPVTRRQGKRRPGTATVPGWARRLFGDRVERLGFERMEAAGRLDWLVGGRPDAVPERYARLSPLGHVHPGCPPTLLVHGTHDTMAPVAATRLLHQRLASSGVPVTARYLPHTDYGFDLVLPRFSPAARTALAQLQHFLATIPRQPHPGHAGRFGPAPAATSAADPECGRPGDDPRSAHP